MDKKAVELLEKMVREIQDIKVMVQESVYEKDKKVEERILREVQDIKVVIQDNFNTEEAIIR